MPQRKNMMNKRKLLKKYAIQLLVRLIKIVLLKENRLQRKRIMMQQQSCDN